MHIVLRKALQVYNDFCSISVIKRSKSDSRVVLYIDSSVYADFPPRKAIYRQFSLLGENDHRHVFERARVTNGVGR